MKNPALSWLLCLHCGESLRQVQPKLVRGRPCGLQRSRSTNLPLCTACCRVENLYFTYLFVLRAAMKAGPILLDADYDTGSPQEDARTKELVKRQVPPAAAACSSCLWLGLRSSVLLSPAIPFQQAM